LLTRVCSCYSVIKQIKTTLITEYVM
jgi:hypothetical protein